MPIGYSSGSLARVDRLEFVQLRHALTANLPPAQDALINAAASKLHRRLMSSVMFAQVEVEITQDPERLLVAMVRYRPGTRTRQVASYLEAVWITELRLPGLDLFHFLIDDGHVELESVTGDQASGYFLSLHLIAIEGSDEDFDGSSEPKFQPSPKSDAPRTKKRFWMKSSLATGDRGVE